MVSFKDLNLSPNVETTEVEINGKKINVKKYLSVEKKASLINLAVNGSIVNGIVNEVFMDAYFHLFLIESYTDLTFDDLETEDVLSAFDTLYYNNFVDEIISKIPEDEFEYLHFTLQTTRNQVNEYQRSAVVAAKEGREAVDLLSKIDEFKKEKAN